MAHNVTITLTEEQYKHAAKHAEKKGRKIPEDVVAVWWGRTMALATYADGVESGRKMRPYTPRRLAEAERERIVKLAVKEGIAPKASLDALDERTTPKPAKAKPAAAKKAAPKPVAPKKKAKVVKPGKKGPRLIELLDSAEVAKNKARALHEVDPAKRSYEEILNLAGRGLDGELLPKVKVEEGTKAP
jgi:hypothetical protein